MMMENNLSDVILKNMIILFIVLCVFALFIFFLKKIIIKRHFLNSPLNKIDKFTGEEFEDYLYYIYKDAGYKVKKTPRTGDFGVDLILISSNGEKIAIQAKRWKNNVGIKAVQEIVSGKIHYNCDKAFVVTNSYFTKAAIKLAKTNNVELIDRDHINRYINKI